VAILFAEATLLWRAETVDLSLFSQLVTVVGMQAELVQVCPLPDTLTVCVCTYLSTLYSPVTCCLTPFIVGLVASCAGLRVLPLVYLCVCTYLYIKLSRYLLFNAVHCRPACSVCRCLCSSRWCTPACAPYLHIQLSRDAVV